MLHISIGNLFNADVDALVNPVNIKGVMGKGLALQFKQAYPAMFRTYEAARKAREVQLGQVHIYDLGGLVGGPRWIPDLRRAAEAIGGASLLLIDPIVSAVAGDMHRANGVRRSLQAVVDFADAHGCAVIGITHFAKGGAGKSPQNRVIGSQAFGALARMVLVTAKEEGSNRRVMARAKSNIASDDGGVAYSLELATIAGGIDATHAVWAGAIEGTAREILGDVELDDSGEDDDARQDLERMLVDTLREAGGKMATKALQAEVRDARHSWDAAKRLKKSLGIEAKSSVWAAPGYGAYRKSRLEGSAKGAKGALFFLRSLRSLRALFGR